MGFGSPQPGERIETLREMLFLLAMLALWTAVQTLFVGVAWAILVGVLCGYLLTFLIAALEYFSSRCAVGISARLLFLLLATGALLVLCQILTRGAPPELWRMHYRDASLLTAPGSIAVIIGYLIRGHQRDSLTRHRQAA